MSGMWEEQLDSDYLDTGYDDPVYVRPSRRRNGIPFILLLVFLAAVGYLGWRIVYLKSPAQKLIRTTIKPLVEKSDQQNNQAVERCVQRIHDQFDVYRSRVPEFVDDLLSLSTRGRVAWRMVTGGAVEQLVREKFEARIFSADEFQNGLTETVTQFFEEVSANQNELYASVKVALGNHPDVNVQLPDLEQFRKQVSEEIVRAMENQAKGSVYQFVASMAASELAAMVAQRLVTQLLVRVLPGVVSGMGVTAGTASAGGAGGSAVGPLGTAAGIAVGFAVGMAVDWWLSSQYEKQLTDSLINYLNQTESALINGYTTTSQGKETSQPGLKQVLREYCKQVREAQLRCLSQAVAQ
ncbi:MAG: hypothetical protein KatS3mg110_2458 [Pirellulaceae bacterium]|nr:MAG: hypothetical protein KatS3mg110_2458 [Pirellulaceae bacterium]